MIEPVIPKITPPLPYPEMAENQTSTLWQEMDWAEPIKKLCEYVWVVITSTLDSVSRLFFSIFITAEPQDNEVNMLSANPEVLKEIIQDIDTTVDAQRKTLQRMKEDVDSLVIESEPQLADLKSIHEAKEKNIELIVNIRKTYELTEEQKQALDILLSESEEINELLKIKVSLAADSIHAVMEEIKTHFTDAGLENISLHDLKTYLAYEECRTKYTDTFAKSEGTSDPFTQAIQEEIERRNGSPVLSNDQRSKGIPNIGNSCYMASTIQALFASGDLMNKLIQPLTKKTEQKRDRETGAIKTVEEPDAEFNERVAIQKALIAFMNVIKPSAESDADQIEKALEEFRDAVFSNLYLNSELSVWKKISGKTHEYNKKYPSPLCKQHDAVELMMLLLDVIDYHIDLQELWWVEGQPLPDAPRVQPNQFINLSIKGDNPNLQDLIDETFKQQEREDAENARFINKADKQLGPFPKWSEKTKLMNHPNVLAVQLKRFENDPETGRLEKITTHVNLPDNLTINMAKAFETPSEEGDQYRLVSTVKHGGYLGGGHYIANVADEEKWVQYNDGFVKDIRETELKAESHFQDYILIFERINVAKFE